MKKNLYILALAGLAFWAALFFDIFPNSANLFADSHSEESPVSSVKNSDSEYGIPVRILIPKIDVDASLESVGVTADGEMDIPKNPSDAAWFNLGPRPGEYGSAVISGHYGWKNGIAAVFDDLSKLNKGDKIYVEDDKGNAISFTVREIRSYDPDADASDVFNADDGGSHLNLITCEGIWNADLKSYSKRLVVFTDKE